MRPVDAAMVVLILMGLTACADKRDSPSSAVTTPVPSATPFASLEASPSPVPSASEPSPVELKASAEPLEIEGTIDGFVQGGRAWAVYVFAGEGDEPGYEDAIELLQEMGLERGREFSDGGLCDEGADKVFGEDRPVAVVAAYFTQARYARRFGRLFDPPPIGIARVRTYCAD